MGSRTEATRKGHDEAIDMLKTAAAVPELRARAGLRGLGMCLQSLQRPLEALAALRKASMYRSPASRDPKIQQRALELSDRCR
jgi:hypothetical protein